MSSKIRMALAGLTVVALAGGVLAADPADAGKKRKHKKKAKVVKVHKGKSVKQVSKGGDAKAGNGGNGGSGGSSGNVYNTGNVGVGTPATPDTGPGVGVTDEMAACVAAALASGTVDFVVGPGTPAAVALFLETTNPTEPCGDLPPAFTDCLAAAVGPEAGGVGQFLLLPTDIPGCRAITPGTPAVPGGGGSVFSGTGGDGARGGDGGDAFGGTGGSNTNTSTVTVTRDDHSIDVDD